ncbi:DUF3566 domain-containing protein [Streptomyces sp. NPDC085995]|uniref:DUF3566 domain-containing protein n=1 Tax=Streptomyces sp. NPDC085995 TaxID=3154861 RepID=UPI0034458586
MRRNRRAPRRTDAETTRAERRTDEAGAGASARRAPGTAAASSGASSPADTAGTAPAAPPHPGPPDSGPPDPGAVASAEPASAGSAAPAPAAASAPTGEPAAGAALADEPTPDAAPAGGPTTADAAEATDATEATGTADADADAAITVQDEVPPTPDSRIPGGMDALWAWPHGPDGPMGLRVRMPRTDPMSVLMTSFLVSTGLLVCAAVTMPPLWIVLTLLGEELWLPPLWQLALGIVAVVAVTVFATLCALCYNLSARCVGGVRVALAEALPDTTPPEPDADRGSDPEPATAGAPPGP